jgi:tyrosyl-tRNA synthetase
MWRYFELLTRLPEAELAALRGGHPMEAKKRLAETVTAQYHGRDAAAAAADRFVKIHQLRENPEDIPVVELPVEPGVSGLPVVAVLQAAGLVPSKSEARRLLTAGAVEVDGRKIASVYEQLESGRTYLVKVGKRRFSRVKIF